MGTKIAIAAIVTGRKSKIPKERTLIAIKASIPALKSSSSSDTLKTGISQDHSL
jgi:hypothetical protein